jgi:pterin-4a-carbinolamine dehydratase
MLLKIGLRPLKRKVSELRIENLKGWSAAKKVSQVLKRLRFSSFETAKSEF